MKRDRIMINRKLTKKTAVVFFLIFVCTCVLLVTACSCSGQKKETIPESVTTFILPLDEIDNVTDPATEKENDRPEKDNEDTAGYEDSYYMTDASFNDIDTEKESNPVSEETVTESSPEDDEVYTHGNYELPEVSLDD